MFGYKLHNPRDVLQTLHGTCILSYTQYAVTHLNKHVVYEGRYEAMFQVGYGNHLGNFFLEIL